jgi:hypothetical protein
MPPVLYPFMLIAAAAIMAFGMVMLKIAYDLPHPAEFIVTFFSASLVILIGASLGVGFAVRLYSWISRKRKKLP